MCRKVNWECIKVKLVLQKSKLASFINKSKNWQCRKVEVNFGKLFNSFWVLCLLKILSFEWPIKYLAINQKFTGKSIPVRIHSKSVLSVTFRSSFWQILSLRTSVSKYTPEHLSSRFLSTISPCWFADDYRHNKNAVWIYNRGLWRLIGHNAHYLLTLSLETADPAGQ